MAMNLRDLGAEYILETFFGEIPKATNFELRLVVDGMQSGSYDPTTGDIDADALFTYGAACDGTDADNLIMDLVDAVSDTELQGGKNIPFVAWHDTTNPAYDVNTNPLLVDFSWEFTGPLEIAAVAVPVQGYAIVAMYPAGTPTEMLVCCEKFTSDFIPENGATLKITPKIYLGNVGDFTA